MPSSIPELYYHRQWDAYECIGCQEMIEVPEVAILNVSGESRAVNVRNNAENLVLFRELHTIRHEACVGFMDVQKAREHQEQLKSEREVAARMRKVDRVLAKQR